MKQPAKRPANKLGKQLFAYIFVNHNDMAFPTQIKSADRVIKSITNVTSLCS